jgi:hypothetical protein
MIKVAMVRSSGEVGYIVSPAVDSTYTDGETYGDYTARHISTEADDNLFITQSYWDSSADDWAMRPSRPSAMHVWEDSAWVLDVTGAQNAISAEGVRRLYASDWTQLSDSPLDELQRAAWGVYRAEVRATRDAAIAGIAEDPNNYYEVINWPTSPI